LKVHTQHFISEHLPEAWRYGDAVLFLDPEERAYVAKGFSVAGQPMTNLSPEHLARWRSAAMAMLNSLEIQAHLDFYWTVENDYEAFLSEHLTGSDGAAPILARMLLENRVSEYRAAQENNELRYRKLFVFINLEPPPSRVLSYGGRNLFPNDQKFHRILMTEWKAALQKVDQLRDLARSPFESCGMNTRNLSVPEIRKLYRKVFNPHRRLLRVPENPQQEAANLWEETIFCDIERHPPFLKYDENFHAFVSMVGLPQETRTGFLAHLFNLTYPDYAIKLTVRPTDKQKEIKYLQSDYGSKQGLQMSRAQSNKPVNVEMKTQADEIFDEIRVLTQTSQQLFEIQLQGHLWTPTETELLKRVDEFIIRGGYCHGTQFVVEKIAAPEALRACIPGWTRESRLDRFHLVKSANAADFIPAHTDFIGTGRAQLLFATPEGGLMTAHVFTASRPFHNVVVGETGGGKTFLLNSVVTQLVAQGLKSVSVISTKDEFGPLMSMYEGEVISFSDDHPHFLNPCVIAGEAPTQDELSSILAILETIFGDETNESERKLRQSRILKATRLAFESHGINTRIRHLVQVFRQGWPHDDLEALHRLAMILEPYSLNGLYGEFFDSDTKRPLNLSNNFKFFDFSRIQKDKNLSAVMMMTITTGESLRLANLPRHYRKALILDECWAFVNSGAGRDFIENRLRVDRAYNCADFLSSQQIADFLNSKIAPVVMGNCHNFFLLRTRDPKAIATVQKEFNLTDELVSRFRSMPDPSEAGFSRFIHVYRADEKQIAGEGVNKVSGPEALLYSTSSNVSQLRDHFLKGSKDPWDAVCKLAAMSPEERKRATEELQGNQ
jgi:hypothetical protein